MIKEQILLNAFLIKKYLYDLDDVPVNKLKEQLKLNEQNLFLALGWLAHEGKILMRSDEHGVAIVYF